MWWPVKRARGQRFSRPARAVVAVAAGPAEPGHADAGPRGEALDARPGGLDPADDLVAGHQRNPRQRQVAVAEVQVGPAHAARGHPHQHLAGSGVAARQVGEPEGDPGAIEHHRAHAVSFLLGADGGLTTVNGLRAVRAQNEWARRRVLARCARRSRSSRKGGSP